MLLAALADGRTVDYVSFLNRYIEDQEGDALSICHPEQARTTEGSEGASKDPENVSSAMPIQGVLWRILGLLKSTVIPLVFLNGKITIWVRKQN